jgi:hypothetical protein
VPANKKMVSSFELPDAERVEAGIWPVMTHQTFKTKEPGEELAVVRSQIFQNRRLQIGSNSPLELHLVRISGRVHRSCREPPSDTVVHCRV